ncbi:TfoX/Sxy family protein [Faecalicatena contorta]
MMGELSKLPNIGAVVEEQLREAGITTFDQLRAMGSKQAWLKIQEIDSSACIHRLYSLEGAIRGIKKAQLPPDVKEDLKDFYNHFKM